MPTTCSGTMMHNSARCGAQPHSSCMGTWSGNQGMHYKTVIQAQTDNVWPIGRHVPGGESAGKYLSRASAHDFLTALELGTHSEWQAAATTMSGNFQATCPMLSPPLSLAWFRSHHRWLQPPLQQSTMVLAISMVVTTVW